MKKTLATSIFALATVFSSGAYAADIYGQGSTKDAPVSFDAPKKPVNWTGFYIGGQVGYQNSNHNMSVQEDEYVNDGCDGADANDDGSCKTPQEVTPAIDANQDGKFCEGPNGGAVDNLQGGGCGTNPAIVEKAAPKTGTICTAGGSVSSGNPTACAQPVQLVSAQKVASAFIDGLNSSGVFGGVTAGADVQRGNIVFGVFGDYNLGSGSHDVGVDFTDKFALTAKTIEDGDSWILAARVGVLFGEEKRALLYGLAGYGQQDFTYNGFGGSQDVTHSGWVVGAGAEYALTQNVFLGMEYQHFFGGEETIASFSPENPVAGESKVSLKDEVDTDKVMAKLKIKLNGFGN
jgi:opacity protein-like surface antigen